MNDLRNVLDRFDKEEKLITADSYWVWTTKAEKQSCGKFQAGKRLKEVWQLNAPVWMVEQQLIVDADKFPYPEGQSDIYELF